MCCADTTGLNDSSHNNNNNNNNRDNFYGAVTRIPIQGRFNCSIYTSLRVLTSRFFDDTTTEDVRSILTVCVMYCVV